MSITQPAMWRLLGPPEPLGLGHHCIRGQDVAGSGHGPQDVQVHDLVGVVGGVLRVAERQLLPVVGLFAFGEVDGFQTVALGKEKFHQSGKGVIDT